MDFRSVSYYGTSIKESDWLGSDSKSQYLLNLKNNYNQLKNNNWIDCSFTYKFNSHGFRCDEFTNDDSIMFLGCSLTVGTGLPLEDTWAYQVAKSLNLKNINLGQCASSSDTAYRLASCYIKQLKPKIVVIRPPDSSRFEMIDNLGSPIPHLVHYSASVNQYKQWFSCEYNHIINREKNLLAIETLCNKVNSRFIVANTPVAYTAPWYDLARDLAHPGKTHNKQFAEYVLDLINS